MENKKKEITKFNKKDKFHIGLTELYNDYPFKQYDPKKDRIPYVKRADRSDDEYSLRFSHWKRIILTYFDVIKEELFKGGVVTLPYKFGKLRYIKYYVGRTFHGATSKWYRCTNTSGYKIRLRWYKGRGMGFNWKFFRFRPSKKLTKEWQEYLKSNPSIYYNYIDSNYRQRKK